MLSGCCDGTKSFMLSQKSLSGLTVYGSIQQWPNSSESFEFMSFLRANVTAWQDSWKSTLLLIIRRNFVDSWCFGSFKGKYIGASYVLPKRKTFLIVGMPPISKLVNVTRTLRRLNLKVANLA